MLYVLETVVVVVFLYGGFTQVILPLWRGTPLFPIMRKTAKLEHDLRVATGDSADADLEKRIADETRAAASTRRTVRPDESASS